MTVSLLIAIALAVPTLLVIALYGFSKSLPWLYERPRFLAGVEMLIGAVYVAATLYEARNGFEPSDVIPLILGVGFFVSGVYRWFRGTPAQFE